MRRFVPLLALLAGCPDRTVSAVPPVPSGVETKNIPVSADVDILFVIDNSASTGDKQALFAQNFSRFVDVLDGAFPNGRPNLHVGVVSTTVGTGSSASFGSNCPTTAPNDDGKLHSALVGGTVNGTACSSCAINGNFLSDIAADGGGRTTNYSCPVANPLSVALPCIAELGTSGCGFEAPLEAMKRALDRSRPENAGFVRDGAYLAVVVLTDEDDCSVRDPSIFSLDLGTSDFRCQPLYAYDCDTAISATQPGSYTNCRTRTDSYLQDPAAYYNFLTALKPNQVAVAVIGGADLSGRAPNPAGFPIETGSLTIPGSAQPQALALLPSCSTTINGNPAIARPGIRLADFASLFGDRGRYYSVCQDDYSPALADIASTIAIEVSPCLEGNIAQPLQCTVSDVQNIGSTGQTEEQIDPCVMATPDMPAPGGARPCWWANVDLTTCPDPVATPTHLHLHVERTQAPPPGTTQVVSCVATY